MIKRLVVPNSTVTQPWSINDAGAIAGQYEDNNGTYHGFVRAR